MYVVSSRHTVQNISKLVSFAREKAIPLVGGWGAWAQAGALLSYGPNVREMLRHAADYVARILNGANPADLPVQQPARFELTMNLKTARALGVTIPPALLARVIVPCCSSRLRGGDGPEPRLEPSAILIRPEPQDDELDLLILASGGAEPRLDLLI